MKIQGNLLLENLGKLVLDEHKVTLDHKETIQKAANGLTKQLTFLQVVIDMKTNVAIIHGILKTGTEPLFHWEQSLEFVIESSTRSTNKLGDVCDLVQKVVDKCFYNLKILHIESFVSTNGKLVDIERMRSKFLTVVDEAIDPLNFQVSKIQELSAEDAVIIKEIENYKSRLTKRDELTNMHDY